MICSFSKEFSSAQYTSLENSFILEYLPSAGGDAVKVYLYGLYLCSLPEDNSSVADIASVLSLSEETVKDCFLYWEEFGLLSIVSKEPFKVIYLPVKSAFYNKPRKYKAEKYTDFTKGVQDMLPSRMVSTGEYTEYFDIMETYGIKPEAMLMIVKYCTDKKGSDVSYRYISKVAKDFGNRRITTAEKVEKELSSYILRTAEIEKILSALSLKRVPDIDDLNLYKKWTNELSFETENIIFAAKSLKKANMAKLDAFLGELYSVKCFSKEEIESFVRKKQSIFDLTVKINKALSVYVEVIEPEIDAFVSKWLSYGYSDEALLYVASRCFVTGKKSLQDMDALIGELRAEGCVELSAVADHFEAEKKADEFISKILNTCGLSRRPTPWDRDNLNNWKNWNFSEEMILEAAKLAAGKNSPVAYMNGILSGWKNKGIYTAAEVSESTATDGQLTQEAYNREYDRRRTAAIARAQKNLEAARDLSGFSELYERLFSIEKDLAFAEYANNQKALAELEEEKKNLIAKANGLLSSIGLDLSDLSPKYRCGKCNDTGYIGTHRCDCL